MTAQDEFDSMYVTAGELGRRLGLSRSGLYSARVNGFLPQPISVNNRHIFIWKRDVVEANIQAWEIVLKCRRSRIDDR